jgi:hydrogenase maturation protein HypF
VARLALRVEGRVQGVGFRPFVLREARARQLVGWVQNRRGSVQIEIQGPGARLEDFVHALSVELPAPAEVRSIERHAVDEACDTEFRILGSADTERVAPVLPPDLAPCACCREEVRGCGRRGGYAFTTCALCGPRYSISFGLPYDRERTSLRGFPLCSECEAEYADPSDRRFHAQAIACPRCGPELQLHDGESLVSTGASALNDAAAALRAGGILALQGIGGFQLLVDATQPAAVERLRARKDREEKPFAVLFESAAQVARYAQLTPAECELLASPACPIVLVGQRVPVALLDSEWGPAEAALASAVAPGSPLLGALLPASPLHQLLVEQVRRPLVCTSGNLSGEPLYVDAAEALEHLAGVADRFLIHDRPIARALDDSVAQVGSRGVELLRRARGYAPEAVAHVDSQRCVLALGGHQKNTITLVHRGAVISSQHIGDLDSERARELAERVAAELVQFFGAQPELVACDEHPDYASTALARRLAARWQVPLLGVQHHRAHVAAVCAEHGLHGPLLGFAWDGTGYGSDGSIWGGESLRVDGSRFERVARLRPFALPGGERAARQPRRAAFGLLHALGRLQWAERWYGSAELTVRSRALERGIASPVCSSVGRLFDGLAALLELRERCSFEGQAAMELQFLAESTGVEPAYPMPVAPVSESDLLELDWRPTISAALADLDMGVSKAQIAARFHASLVEAAVDVAMRIDLARVVLSGGCFQNRWLSRELRARLEARGSEVYSASRIPSNDGGLSVGQAWLALAAAEGKQPCA